MLALCCFRLKLTHLVFFYTRIEYFLTDHIGLRGGGFFGARDALGVVTYPFNQVLFSSTHFESADLLRISAMLSMQTGLQVSSFTFYWFTLINIC